MPIGTWLLGLATPILWKVLASLGMGILTYVGVDAAVSSALGAAQSNWGQLGGTAAQLVGLSGANEALSIIAGGVTARVSFMAFKKLTFI